MTTPPTETLIIKRRWGERLDNFMLRVMLWQALGDKVDWLPSLLPWRGVSAARITREDRLPNLNLDPITTSEPLRFMVRRFVREELGQTESRFHQTDE